MGRKHLSHPADLRENWKIYIPHLYSMPAYGDPVGISQIYLVVGILKCLGMLKKI